MSGFGIIGRLFSNIMAIPAFKLLRLNSILALSGLAVSIMLARALEPELRGLLASILLWVGFASNVGLGGIHLFLSRSKSFKTAGNVYPLAARTVTVLSLVAVIGFLAISTLSSNFGDLASLALLLAAIAIPFGMMNGVQVQVELGQNRLDNYAFARFSFSILYAIAVFGLWWSGQNLVTLFIAAFTGASVIATFSTAFKVRKDVKSLTVEKQTSVLDVLTASARDGLSVAILSLTSMADRLLISLFFPPRIMGLYVVALTLSQIQGIITEATAPLFFARQSMQKNHDIADNERLSQRLRQTILLNIGITVLVLLAAPFAIPLLFGNNYSSALTLAYLLIPALSLRGMMRPFEEVLKGSDHAMLQSQALVMTSAIFAALAIPAIYVNRVDYVVWALIVANFAGLIAVSYSTARVMKIKHSQLLFLRPTDATSLLREISMRTMKR